MLRPIGDPSANKNAHPAACPVVRGQKQMEVVDVHLAEFVSLMEFA
jgi:hypothetical protein